MKLSFEAEAALRYNPYSDGRFRIVFDDPFWHLNKESIEETFDRLLARQHFNALSHLLVAFFDTRATALAALCEFVTFDSFLSGAGVSFLKGDEKTDASLQCSGGWGNSLFGSVEFEAYDGRVLRIDAGSKETLASHYSIFRARLFEERKRQSKRPRWACQNRWDG
jgi:hypothetical protein